MDLVYYLPKEIDYDVQAWLSWPNEPKDSNKEFLRHLSVFRQISADKMDQAIILDPNVILPDNFDDKVNKLLDDTDDHELDFDILLLSSYVTNWTGIRYYSLKDICSVTENVKGSFAYWISRDFIENKLSIYDRPLRTISINDINLNVEILTRSDKMAMASYPLCYRNDTPFYHNYFKQWNLY